MRSYSVISCACAIAWFVLGGSGPSARAGEAYTEGTGVRPWFSLLKPARNNPSDQLAFARMLRDRGSTWRAKRHYRALTENWPLAPEAGLALLERAEILQRQQRWQLAFEEYRKLESFSSSPLPYTELLQRQRALALALMNRKNFRWLLGGWTYPQQALPLLETLARSATGWAGAADAQIQIARIHRDDHNWSEAAAAYQEYLIRFPEGVAIEEAALGRAMALDEMSRDAPNDPMLGREARSALDAFLRTYPDSTSAGSVRKRLERRSAELAESAWRVAHHYDRHHRSSEAARLGYERFLTQYPNSKYTRRAQERLLYYERRATPAAPNPPEELDHANTPADLPS
ncbi:MAG: outer membrane protein assembly factor BamD [Kiritimatiellae bacterium]|nr:outer membrane protein assembly factor BamD [Kiritimatiellia bacterium]